MCGECVPLKSKWFQVANCYFSMVGIVVIRGECCIYTQHAHTRKFQRGVVFLNFQRTKA